MATTCRESFFFVISLLNKEYLKNTQFIGYDFGILVATKWKTLFVGYTKESGGYELLENFYGLPVEKRPLPWLLSERLLEGVNEILIEFSKTGCDFTLITGYHL